MAYVEPLVVGCTAITGQRSNRVAMHGRQRGGGGARGGCVCGGGPVGGGLGVGGACATAVRLAAPGAMVFRRAPLSGFQVGSAGTLCPAQVRCVSRPATNSAPPPAYVRRPARVYPGSSPGGSSRRQRAPRPHSRRSVPRPPGPFPTPHSRLPHHQHPHQHHREKCPAGKRPGLPPACPAAGRGGRRAPAP